MGWKILRRTTLDRFFDHSQPVPEWPHEILVSLYGTMEHVAMHGSPLQRRQVAFLGLILHKEATTNMELPFDCHLPEVAWPSLINWAQLTEDELQALIDGVLTERRRRQR
jgi:hypothetical protein